MTFEQSLTQRRNRLLATKEKVFQAKEYAIQKPQKLKCLKKHVSKVDAGGGGSTGNQILYHLGGHDKALGSDSDAMGTHYRAVKEKNRMI